MFGDDAGSFFGTDDYGGISLSTVDPNPSLDQSAGATDSSSTMDWINSLGQWGATLTSIATRTPVTTSPSGTILGARSPSLLGSTSSNQMLLTVVIIAIIAFALISLAKKTRSE